MAQRIPRDESLSRVHGVGALFSAAYGNVGSSIYYALGVTAAFALGLTPIAFVVSGLIFAATADALPEIAEAVDGRATLLVDGGIRRGVDVATALALGADAVLVGRPALWGLAAGGSAGVARVLELLREELELALGLLGCTGVSQLARGHVRRAPAASVYSL